MYRNRPERTQLPIDHPDEQWEILKRLRLGPAYDAVTPVVRSDDPSGSREGSFLPADEPATAKPLEANEGKIRHIDEVPERQDHGIPDDPILGQGAPQDVDPLFPLYMEEDEDEDEVLNIEEEVEV